MIEDDEDKLQRTLTNMVINAHSSQWLPIRTAPKDGTPILVFCPSHHLEAYEDFFAVVKWVDAAYDGTEGWFDNFDRLLPTHWMTIPKAPKP